MPVLYTYLNNWLYIITLLQAQQNHIAQVVPQEPTGFGATNAWFFGMGVILFSTDDAPNVFHCNHPPDSSAPLVSWDNPSVDQNINNTELALYNNQLAIVSTWYD